MAMPWTVKECAIAASVPRRSRKATCTIHSPVAVGSASRRTSPRTGFVSIIRRCLAIVPGSAVVARAADARWWYRAVSLLIAAVGIAAYLMLANYNVWTYRYAPIGLVERVPVYSILAWQVFSGVVLLTRPAWDDTR